MFKEISSEVEEKMKKVIHWVEGELSRLRTGKANTSLVERIKVPYYGQSSFLNQVAHIFTPDAHTILIKPWDKSLLPQIQKVLLQSNLGITPQSNGQALRLTVPPLTQEKRQELTKVAKEIVEKGKVSLRNIRREGNDKVKKAYRENKLSQDEEKKLIGEIQKITDKQTAKLEELFERKRIEIQET
jgi:ribosome recycling factor